MTKIISFAKRLNPLLLPFACNRSWRWLLLGALTQPCQELIQMYRWMSLEDF